MQKVTPEQKDAANLLEVTLAGSAIVSHYEKNSDSENPSAAVTSTFMGNIIEALAVKGHDL